MKNFFYWVGGIGCFILLIVSIKTTQNAFEWVQLTMNSYPRFFIKWVLYDIMYLLTLYGIYWVIISIKEK